MEADCPTEVSKICPALKLEVSKHPANKAGLFKHNKC